MQINKVGAYSVVTQLDPESVELQVTQGITKVVAVDAYLFNCFPLTQIFKQHLHLGDWETVDLIFVLFYFVFSILPYKSLVAVFLVAHIWSLQLQLMACDKIKALSSWWFDWTLLSYPRTPGGRRFLRKIVMKQKSEKQDMNF